MKPKRIIAPDNSWEKWVLNNKIHREDGSAVIKYNDGNVIEEQWRVEGRLHRKDAPAIIRYKDGVVVEEEWFTNNIRHRIDGSARIEYNNGKVNAEQWWVDGTRVTKEDFTSIDMIDRMKAYSLFAPIEIARMRKNAA